MFKKRQTRNLRKKSSDDEDGGAQSGSESRGSNNSALVKKVDDVSSSDLKHVPTTSSLLSFGDEEEEGDVFKTTTKSSSGRNAERARPRQRGKERAVEKDKGLHFSSSNKTETIVKFVGKPVNKKEELESPIVISDGEEENIDTGNEEEPVMGKFKQVLTSGAIPDASLIHLARKQRQMAREMGTVDAPGGYIPLKKVDDTQKYKKDSSRLIREDDENENSDSGEEGGKFYSKLRDEDEEERRQVEADFLRVEQGDSDEDKDDELDRWEREQIRKGVSTNQMSYFAQEYLTSVSGSRYTSYAHYEQPPIIELDKEIKEPQPMELDMDLTNDDDDEDIHKSLASRGMPKVGGHVGPSSESLPTFNGVRSKLEQRLEEQESVHRGRLLDRDKVRDSLTENETTLAKLEQQVPQLSAQFQFYQEMRTYVRDLLDCFNEKVPLIEKAASGMMDLWIGRARFLAKRRQQDVKDQYDDCSAAASGKMQLLQQDSDRMMRVADREARRTRRRQAREKTLSSLGHHEGMSSDEEEAPSKIVAFNNEKEKLCLETAEIFKDTQEEFYSIDDVTRRLMEWRKVFKRSFDEAYVIHCLPKLLAPLVKWQMLVWNPVEADAQPLRTVQWCISLEKTCQSIAIDSSDADFDIVFPLVDVAVLPRVKDIVEHVWDPTSSSQSANLVGFLSGLQRDYPKSSAKGKHFSDLKDAIRNRIKRSFDDDLFTPIYSKEVIENKACGASAFLDRQFWFSIKVLQNVGAWTSVFTNSEVQEWVFDGVVNRHVVLALQCGGAADTTTLTRCKAVCSALPSSWFSDKKESDMLPQLHPFCKLLLRIADELNESKGTEKSTVRDSTKEIHRLLLKLNARSYANMLSQKYRVK